MPRRPNPVPTYRLHKQSGQAVVTLRTADGRRRDYLLGPYGSPESRTEYERLLAESRVSPAVVPAAAGEPYPAPTVNELLLAFMRHATGHYAGPDGKPTRELTEYRQCAKLVRDLYGHTPAREFGPLALKTVRRRMVDAGLCRRVVNLRVGRIKRMFKFAASEELVPVAVYQSLATVAGLQRGRSGVRDRDPVKPVDPDHARAVQPFVRPEVAAMIEVQLLTGMRPGEVCRLRPAEVDTSGVVWLYRPRQHKTAWRGKARVIAIGPKAQAVLRPFWPADPADYVFSPKRAVAAMHAARTAARTTKLYPSHARRNAAMRKANPKRPPAERYSTLGYGHAIVKGVKRRNRAAPDAPPLPHWHPNQLRHTFATSVRAKYGLEAAGAGLGHAKMSVTEVYAERDLSLALRVAAEAG